MEDLKASFEKSLQEIAHRALRYQELANSETDEIIKARYIGYVNGLCYAAMMFDELPL